MDSFEFSMELCNDTSLNMIVNGMFRESNILGINELRGEFKKDSDELLFLSDDPYIYKNILEDYIDFESDVHRKPITGITSTIPFNLAPGSTSSMNFLEMIENSDDRMIYQSDLNLYVDYKWN